MLDYGQNVGGLPKFTVRAETGSPTLLAGYSEARQFLTPNGDGGNPFGSGDPSRSDSYTVSRAGYHRQPVRTGRRALPGDQPDLPGQRDAERVEIYYEPYLGTPEYKGYFVSSPPALNKIWYDGAYTVNMVQMRPDTPGGYWQIAGGAAVRRRRGSGQLTTGAAWTDYTSRSARRSRPTRPAGWYAARIRPTTTC